MGWNGIAWLHARTHPAHHQSPIIPPPSLMGGGAMMERPIIPPPSHPINPPPIFDGGVRWIDGGAIDGGMGEVVAAHSIHGWNGSEEWDGYAYGLDGNGGWI